MLRYTICFIKRNNELLLLNRNKEPNMGMWNGVGGKVERNESPYDGIIRETLEETGIRLNKPLFAGNVTWKSNRGDSGMHVFIADLPKIININTPISTREGILEWKSIDWILNLGNSGIVDNIKIYLPKMLNKENLLEYKFVYQNGEMVDYTVSTLTEKDIECITSVTN